MWRLVSSSSYTVITSTRGKLLSENARMCVSVNPMRDKALEQWVKADGGVPLA